MNCENIDRKPTEGEIAYKSSSIMAPDFSDRLVRSIQAARCREEAVLSYFKSFASKTE